MTPNVPKEVIIHQLTQELTTMESRLKTNEELYAKVSEARKGLVEEQDPGKFKSGMSAISAALAALDTILLTQELTMKGNMDELRARIPECRAALKQASGPLVIPRLGHPHPGGRN